MLFLSIRTIKIREKDVFILFVIMIYRILHRKLFISCFVLFLIGWYTLGGWGTFWFNLFSAWTFKQGNIQIGENYVKESDVDDTIVWLVIANMTLGEWRLQVKWEKVMQDAIRLFETSEVLINVDILDLVTENEDSEWVLKSHMEHTRKTLESIQANTLQLREIAQSYVAQSNECLGEKRSGDQQFFQWVQANDTVETVIWLEMSLEFAPCYITNRIKANAYAYMAEKVATHASILNRRYQLLLVNSDAILNNTAYLEWNVLEQLMVLRTNIQEVNRVSYEQVEWLLNLQVFSWERDITSLPDYDKVFFGDQNTSPRFQETGIEWIKFWSRWIHMCI